MAKLTPQQRIQLAYDTEKKYGLPKGMLVAQLNDESSNGKNNYNASSGATGPMQFMPATAAAYGVDPNDDSQAIDGAGRYMADNLKQAGGNVGKALELYYAGSPSGIGPKSKAYPGQVAANWNDDDAFDAASNFNAPTPQTVNDDTDFEKSASLTPDQAPAPTSQQPETTRTDPAIASLEEGMQKIASITHSPYQVRRYVRESGYDPDSMVNLDANVQAGKLRFQNFNPKPIEHDTSNDLLAGVERGASDVTGSISGFASYMDNKFPFLASIDRAAANVVPALDPNNLSADYQSSILSRRAYDQNYDSLASGAGRLGAQVALTAPILGAFGKAAMAVAPEAVSASPAVDFLAGRGGTNFLTRGLSMSAAGAQYGAAGNALTSVASDEPVGQRIETGVKAGAALGPAIGGLAAAGSAVGNRIAPGVDSATAKLAQLAHDKFGITLDADQITNSPLVRKVSAMMNLNPINNHLARDATQRGQFTRAVGRTFGADSDSLTPEVMQGAKDRLGAQFDQIAARNPVHVDDNMLGDFAQIESEAQQALPQGEFTPIAKQLDNVITQASKNGDTLTGEQYQALTRKGSPLDVASNSANPNIRHYAIQIRGALDDALERSAGPEDVKALQSARLQYKNMKTVEPLVSKSADNQITPALLNNRVSVNFKNRAYQGAGDLDELAQIGTRFLNPPHTSGTPEGIRAQRLLEGAGAGGALSLAVGGHLLGYGNLGDLAGLGLFAGRRVAGAGTNAIIKRVIQSEAYKNRLLNGAVDGDISSSVNGLPPAFVLTGNRIVQQVSPPPKNR
jgi:hypothetical protein